MMKIKKLTKGLIAMGAIVAIVSSSLPVSAGTKTETQTIGNVKCSLRTTVGSRSVYSSISVPSTQALQITNTGIYKYGTDNYTVSETKSATTSGYGFGIVPAHSGYTFEQGKVMYKVASSAYTTSWIKAD